MGRGLAWAAAAVAALAAAAVIPAAVIPAHAAGYVHAGGVMPVVTFEFGDGVVEVHEFPVFWMDTDFVTNGGSPEFTLIGVVDGAPYLHRMLDTAFERKQSAIRQWNYQQADITVDFVRAGAGENGTAGAAAAAVRTLSYHDCSAEDYEVTTMADDQESYMSSKSGFAVVYKMRFLCSGLHPASPSQAWYDPGRVVEHGRTDFDYYGGIRAWAEFAFDGGSERIEFPYFELASGYAEGAETPSFVVEGVVGDYPLLYDAVGKARAIHGVASHSNTDFDVLITFERGRDPENTPQLQQQQLQPPPSNVTVLRGLSFAGCTVDSYEVRTLFDKEEGFVGKTGFAQVGRVGVGCAGLGGENPRYDEVYGARGADGRGGGGVLNVHEPAGLPYVSSAGLEVYATFTHDGGRETAAFPVFRQGGVLGLNGAGIASNPVPPAFELAGQISDLPLLYAAADQSMENAFATGAGHFLDLFDVDVRLVYGGGAGGGAEGGEGGNGEHAAVVRGFEYKDCRVTDYVVRTAGDKEEAYFKGFAHTNTFDFECAGYRPYDPVYDALFEVHRPDLFSSIDYEHGQIRRR